MFVPDMYRPPESRWTVDLVRSFPMATLVTAGPRWPLITHLPTVLAHDVAGGDTEPAELAGSTIYGHLNRSNPHAAALASGTAAVLVFQGPGGYVSPVVYDTDPAAPTWNFAAVHLHGTLRRIESRAETRLVMQATARVLESRFGLGWDMSNSLGYFDMLLPGVDAFEVAIESVDGMFKLSQEKEPDVRRRVAEEFARSTHGLHRDLAAMMNRLAPSPCRVTP